MKYSLLIALFLFPVVSFASIPSFPMAFWGTVTVDGVSAPVGSVVRVYSGTEEIGEVTVQSVGVYGYTEPTKQKLVVSEADGTLSFSIQSPAINGGVETSGLVPVTHEEFVSGETVNKNLAFKLTNTTKPSSGGGGGGGSKKKVKEAPLVLGSATSTLSEEEKKIEMQKQIILLLTQLIKLLQLKYAQ